MLFRCVHPARGFKGRVHDENVKIQRFLQKNKKYLKDRSSDNARANSCTIDSLGDFGGKSGQVVDKEGREEKGNNADVCNNGNNGCNQGGKNVLMYRIDLELELVWRDEAITEHFARVKENLKCKAKEI
ncbi:hypothetical protein RUM43_010812 [Polyplax serrata]|uniref:Uncharacterized protein n=1 Tax=Polyplax serrata TaxID=468196 RepID=A0AAN8RZH3_POLSC